MKNNKNCIEVDITKSIYTYSKGEDNLHLVVGEVDRCRKVSGTRNMGPYIPEN